MLKKLKKGRAEPVVITQRGRAAAVMLGVEEYQRSLDERDLLLALSRGEAEIQKGDGHSLDEILADFKKRQSSR